MCICTLYLRVADAMCSSCSHVRHYIQNQFVLSGLGGVPYAYMCFVEACKRDCGRRNRLAKFMM